jgi:hypothetical protein
VALAAAAVQSLSPTRQPHRTPHTWLNMQRIRFCSPPVLTATERINAWLRDSANPESDAEVTLSHPSKRRRHSDLCPMERSRPQSPPKRPRVECDEPITPNQSASVVGSVTSLTEKTTLSMRSNASRSSSPQRQITQLQTARPPIFFYPLATAGECVPAAVAPRIRTLQTRLRHRLEREYIPACLRDALERDPTYKAALLFDPIEDTAYYDDKEEADAALVLDRVKAVFQGTHLCKQHTMDENAWCLHVVTPLLQLAIILYGRGRFRQESVYVSLFLTSPHTNNVDNRSPSSPPTSPPPPPPAPSPPPSSARPTSACPTHTSILCMPASTRPSVTPPSATPPTPTRKPSLSSPVSKSSPPREAFKRHSCR